MTPATAATASQSVAVTFQDATASSNIVTGWVLTNSAVNAGNACYVAYFAPGNLLFLYPDSGDGSQALTMPLSGTNTVENSQCRVNAQGSSAVANGGQITLTLNITAKSALVGPKGVLDRNAKQFRSNQRVANCRLLASAVARCRSSHTFTVSRVYRHS